MGLDRAEDGGDGTEDARALRRERKAIAVGPGRPALPAAARDADEVGATPNHVDEEESHRRVERDRETSRSAPLLAAAVARVPTGSLAMIRCISLMLAMVGSSNPKSTCRSLRAP